jgi:hypothetical protein
MKYSLTILVIFLLSINSISQKKIAKVTPHSIPINRNWDILPKPSTVTEYRKTLNQAGILLGSWKIYVAGNLISGEKLKTIATSSPEEPLLRIIREKTKQAIDLYDFLLFLDDVLLAGKKGLRGTLIWVPSGRARRAGILIHPSDIFQKKPRLYACSKKIIHIDKPQPPASLPPAHDGDLLGPNWTARFKNPVKEKRKLQLLQQKNPGKTFVPRIKLLVRQLRDQGCRVYIGSTVRSRSRGYLMWGSFALSKCSDKKHTQKLIRKLNSLNKQRKLHIAIKWQHPKGWQTTVQEARRMAETYQVVYATERGAFHSNHYDGKAIDMSATGLPRILQLISPEGKKKTFNLSSPEETRDLSLTPKIINWIEKHFKMKKLRSDYPHWDDIEQQK